MSTNHHTDIPSTGVSATAANINSPLGELDSAITTISNGIVGLNFLRISGSDPQTISVGAVTILKSYVIIDTEAAAATDDLDTISGGQEGMLLFVKGASAARVVTLKDGTGNIKNTGDQDIELTSVDTIIAYIYDGTDWVSVNTIGSPTPEVSYVDFDLLVGTPTHTTGRVWYDVGNKTLTVDMDGGVTRLQVGQENLFQAKNDTGLDIDDATPIYISGATGNLPTIALAKADAEATSKLAGLATDDILNNANGWVANIGKINNINTTGTPVGEVWADGETLYVSPTTAGELTNVQPVAPNFIVQVGIVANAHITQGIIELDIQWTGNLTTMADVNGTTPAEGDVLVWDDTNKYYDPAEAPYAPGYISGLEVTVASDTDVGIAVGNCRDGAGTFNMTVGSPITIDPSGTGVNGLDTGVLAVDTWYYVWVISGTSGTGGLMSTSSSPTLPAGYNVSKRRVGWARAEGSANLQRSEMIDQNIVHYNEDTTSGDFVILTSYDASTSPTYDSITATDKVCPPGTRWIFTTIDTLPDTGGLILYYRASANQIIRVGRGTASQRGAFTANLPLDSSQHFELSESIAGDNNTNMFLFAYTDVR